MAVKRRKEKKRLREELMSKAVRIKCCYCDIKETCRLRANKEKAEQRGTMTYCTVTPNRPRSITTKTN